MKIILTQEVPTWVPPRRCGRGQDGYGRNYLVPQGLAILATKGAEKQIATSSGLARS